MFSEHAGQQRAQDDVTAMHVAARACPATPSINIRCSACSHLFLCVVAALHQPVHNLRGRGLVLQVVDGTCRNGTAMCDGSLYYIKSFGFGAEGLIPVSGPKAPVAPKVL